MMRAEEGERVGRVGERDVRGKARQRGEEERERGDRWVRA